MIKEDFFKRKQILFVFFVADAIFGYALTQLFIKHEHLFLSLVLFLICCFLTKNIFRIFLTILSGTPNANFDNKLLEAFNTWNKSEPFIEKHFDRFIYNNLKNNFDKFKLFYIKDYELILIILRDNYISKNKINIDMNSKVILQLLHKLNKDCLKENN